MTFDLEGQVESWATCSLSGCLVSSLFRSVHSSHSQNNVVLFLPAWSVLVDKAQSFLSLKRTGMGCSSKILLSFSETQVTLGLTVKFKWVYCKTFESYWITVLGSVTQVILCLVLGVFWHWVGGLFRSVLRIFCALYVYLSPFFPQVPASILAQ